MRLPGGLWRGGERRRSLRWRPLDGRLELSMAEAGTRPGSTPERVGFALAAALEMVGDEPVTESLVGELCVGDRQFLMHRLAERLGLGCPWLTETCHRCQERFDFEVRLEDMPVREAGASYPFADVELSAGRLRLRLPTGRDQAAISTLDDPAQAERELLARCLVEGEAGTLERLGRADLEHIDAALEAVSPAVVTRLAATCPTCGHVQAMEFDPYQALRMSPTRTLDDVHTLAWTYHWSEQDILSLPRHRRQYYLACVDRARGLAS
jgi:hypothetical protein